MFTFLSSPVFWSSIFTFLIALYFSFLAGRALLRCEQLAKRVQVLEDFNEDIAEQVELQLAAKGLHPINGDVSEAQSSLEAICSDLEKFGSVQPIGHRATNDSETELARRTVVADRILKDLVHSRSELDKAWEHLIENGAATDVQVELAEARQTIGSAVFGLLALHHAVAWFMREFSFVRDHGPSGYLKFPGFGEHFRKAREAEEAKRTAKEQSQCTS